MSLGDALRTAAGAEEIAAGLPIAGIDGSSWIERLLRSAGDMQLEHVDQPAGFLGTLRPYQLRGLQWLVFMQRVGIGACLADDMGLGKTIQLIALLLEERLLGDCPGPTLIFAPMTVVGNWRREIERFAPALKVLVHHGPERATGDAFVTAAQAHDVVISTYALGHRDQDVLGRVAWHRIALDEAQKIKNPAAAQTIAIRGLGGAYRVALTGTPLENHLSELWSIMEMLNPGLLGSAARFRKRFAVPIERMGDNQRAAQLRSLIRPFVLRRTKNDPDVACDLPEKMEMQVYCNLTPEQAGLYEQVVDATLGEVESATGIRRRGVILAALTRLKQICNHPVQYLRDGSRLDERSGKCERLVEMLEEVIAEDDAALIFTQFREMGGLLAALLTERLHTEVLFLHGGTTAAGRQRMIDRFQDPASGVRIFLLSLRAGGLGLNLTAANHVFHFDRWWNPSVEAQATDRAHRIGQTRRVQVHKFVCLGTIEDRIDRMLTEKLALADSIVGSGDEWLTGLSTEELRDCLRLSRDAVGEMTNGGL
jgi:SNF2 family DNA or RNA helicase